MLKCSRCHQAWFCSVQCQKAYWPFHKSVCRRNDFADAIESTEPKFASWMRKHGKIAVLKVINAQQSKSFASKDCSCCCLCSSVKLEAWSDARCLPSSFFVG